MYFTWYNRRVPKFTNASLPFDVPKKSKGQIITYAARRPDEKLRCDRQSLQFDFYFVATLYSRTRKLFTQQKLIPNRSQFGHTQHQFRRAFSTSVRSTKPTHKLSKEPAKNSALLNTRQVLKLVQCIARSPGPRDVYGLFLTTERKQNNKKICLPCFGVPNVDQEFRPALIVFWATAKIHQTPKQEAGPTARQIKHGRVERHAAPLTFPKRQAVQSVPTTTGRRRRANMLNAKRSDSTTARLQARAQSTVVSGVVRDRMPLVSGIYTLLMTAEKMHN